MLLFRTLIPHTPSLFFQTFISCPVSSLGVSFVCAGAISREAYTDFDDIPLRFIGPGGVVTLCGPDLSPLPPFVNTDPTRDDSLYSSHNLDSNVTSSR